MAILGFELEEILHLIALAEASGLSEFVWKDGDRSIRLRGPRPPLAETRAVLPPSLEEVSVLQEVRRRPHAAAIVNGSATKTTDSVNGLTAEQIALTAPTVGTFFRAEKPGAPAFVEVGQQVRVGQPIGVIEAMKNFFEIPAEAAGTILAIPAQDGQLVQEGAPLVILQK